MCSPHAPAQDGLLQPQHLLVAFDMSLPERHSHWMYTSARPPNKSVLAKVKDESKTVVTTARLSLRTICQETGPPVERPVRFLANLDKRRT